MSEKNFFEIFNLYKPSDELFGAESVLRSARDIKVRADKERRFLEIHITLDALAEKELLYGVEREMASVYRLNCVRILPHYSSALFGVGYIPQILLEAERTGIVARGFFSRYETTLLDNDLTITLPFSQGGVKLLYDANTPKIIERIILSEFNLTCSVKIERDDLVNGLTGMFLNGTDGNTASRVVNENVKPAEGFVGILFQGYPAIVAFYVMSEDIIGPRFLLRFFKS